MNGTDGPTAVSVVIPAYKPNFFKQCLESALSQTHENIEILVSDDCPAEDIRRICEPFPQVHYSRNPNPGHYANFDRCMRIAQGEFIKFLFDDDLLQPTCIETMLRTYRQAVFPEPVRLVACAYEQIDETGAVLRRCGFDGLAETHRFGVGEVARSLAYHVHNPIGALTSVLIPRAAAEALGPDYFVRRMASGARGLSDVALYTDLSLAGPIAYLSRPLVKLRMSAFNLTNQSVNPAFIHSLMAWETIASEAVDLKVLNERQYRHSLEIILAGYRRWEGSYPVLAEARRRIEAGSAR